MRYSVECFRNVDGHRCSAKRWLPLVETVGYLCGGGKECGGGRVERAETVLGGGGRQGRREEREN